MKYQEPVTEKEKESSRKFNEQMKSFDEPDWNYIFGENVYEENKN